MLGIQPCRQLFGISLIIIFPPIALGITVTIHLPILSLTTSNIGTGNNITLDFCKDLLSDRVSRFCHSGQDTQFVGNVTYTMKAPVRIAILECDTPPPNTKAKYGGYGGVFEHLLRSGAHARGSTAPDTAFKISKYQIELGADNYPREDDIDAILITGSRMHPCDYVGGRGGS
jgi:hypothetical protein